MYACINVCGECVCIYSWSLHGHENTRKYNMHTKWLVEDVYVLCMWDFKYMRTLALTQLILLKCTYALHT